ncbi:hypothetical protein ACFL09_00170 [Planctomycetota bacterium]
MPRPRPHIAPPSTCTKTILEDEDGSVILEMGYEDFIITNPDGSVTQQKISRSIRLACGTMWNPLMMMAKPPILVGVCGQCRRRRLFRKPSSHGIVVLRRASYCAGCGVLLCPKHRKLCRDRKWRCRSCARKFGFRRMLSGVFFVCEDE